MTVEYIISTDDYIGHASNLDEPKILEVYICRLHDDNKYNTSPVKFRQLVKDIVYHYFVERICLETRISGYQGDDDDDEFCRETRGFSCRCQYIADVMYKLSK